MNSPDTPERPSPADFWLAGWLVQPSLNRLSFNDQVIHIEPKLMDVLVYLADNAGRVMSKIDISDAVWPDLFITESVITRSIAGLRRAFGDDAKDPTFIETISKRGYRLIAAVERTPAGDERSSPLQRPGHQQTVNLGKTTVPFVVGQWVRRENFYGRGAVINEVLSGNRNWLWLLGTRRIGKTSVLKQLEYLALDSPDLGFLPVFWDLQGADRPEELHLDFADALLDAEGRLEEAGVPLAEVRTDDCFESLGRLRRRLFTKNLRLLLLCDEVEELIQLNRQDPSILRKLRRALHSRDGIRSVLASSSKLWQLAQTNEDTSPFLDGFTPPLAIGSLDDDEARQLIRQTQLPEATHPSFSDDEVERIRRQCGNHPYQIQLLCRRALDLKDLDDAIEDVAHDRAVSFFFSVDYELRSEVERTILRFLADQPGASPAEIGRHTQELSDAITISLSALYELGIVSRDRDGRYEIASLFLRRWLVDGAAIPPNDAEDVS
jgi:DNA-binding winged helix-turn-helix (wHTH) protein/DNA-binding transcriptional ArsR family regulator